MFLSAYRFSCKRGGFNLAIYFALAALVPEDAVHAVAGVQYACKALFIGCCINHSLSPVTYIEKR